MKKTLALFMGALLLCGAFTGCGSRSISEEAQQTEDVVTYDELSSNYAEMKQLYESAKNAYEDPNTSADAEIEKELEFAASIINSTGELSKENYQTLGQIKPLYDDIKKASDGLNDALGKISAEGLLPVVNSHSYEETEAEYNALKEIYAKAKAAADSGTVKPDEEQAAALTEAEALINTIGEISPQSFTTQQAITDCAVSVKRLSDVLKPMTEGPQ